MMLSCKVIVNLRTYALISLLLIIGGAHVDVYLDTLVSDKQIQLQVEL